MSVEDLKIQKPMVIGIGETAIISKKLIAKLLIDKLRNSPKASEELAQNFFSIAEMIEDLIGEDAEVVFSHQPMRAVDELILLERVNEKIEIAHIKSPDIEPYTDIFKIKILRNFRKFIENVNKGKFLPAFKEWLITHAFDVAWSAMNTPTSKTRDVSVIEAHQKAERSQNPRVIRLNTFQFIKIVNGEQLLDDKKIAEAVSLIKNLHEHSPVQVAVEISPHHELSNGKKNAAMPVNIVKCLTRELGELIPVGYEIDIGHIYALMGSEEVALKKIKELFDDTETPVTDLTISPKEAHHTGLEESLSYILRAIEIAHEAHVAGKWEKPVFILEPQAKEAEAMIAHLPNILSLFKRKRLEH